ncbi:MAG TPA: hypothetical protein VHM90_04610 [Phycisphaerae bacterium]|nr:hypothetical protein [Phycisphaerae bacterium]
MTETRIHEILDAALAHRQAGDLKSAIDAIDPLLRVSPPKASQAMIIATLFFESEAWKSAAHWFGVAARLNPDSEKASLGLFHSLWEMDNRREALTEMARYRASHHSAEYDALHRDLTEEFLEYMAYMNGARLAPMPRTVAHRRVGAKARRVA